MPVARTTAAARPRGLTSVVSAADYGLAVLDLGLGRPDDALERLLRLVADGHILYRFVATTDLIEAAAGAARPDDALGALAWLKPWAQGREEGSLGAAMLARAPPLLARPEEADSLFPAALGMQPREASPFYRARLERSHGEFLRRARRRTEARTVLRAAHAGFEAFGAEPWADRAAVELRATGETARRRDLVSLAELTPQELQIARLVAQGASNRHVGARLYLSPKTVEYHLRKVFQKLGIASRTDLVRLASSGESHELAGSAA